MYDKRAEIAYLEVLLHELTDKSRSSYQNLQWALLVLMKASTYSSGHCSVPTLNDVDVYTSDLERVNDTFKNARNGASMVYQKINPKLIENIYDGLIYNLDRFGVDKANDMLKRNIERVLSAETGMSIEEIYKAININSAISTIISDGGIHIIVNEE